MNSIKKLGVLYGRLGLSTNAELIERRGAGVAAASAALEKSEIAPLLRRAFGIGKASETSAFLEKIGEADPTFDVRAEDVETALLAAAVLDHVIEQEHKFCREVTLGVVTASTCGIRRPSNHDTLFSDAERMLARFQSSHSAAPAYQQYSKPSSAFTAAVESIPVSNGNQYFTHPASHNIVTAFNEIGEYAETNALAAARNDTVVLEYVRRLEKELQLYWWVTSGWSVDAAQPFAKLGVLEAALRCGMELADKTFNQIGLFAAPAMLDMILERGRKSDTFAPTPFQVIATTGALAWRRESFDEGSGPLSDLLPISMCLHMAAESDDADDWHGRFQRLTGIEVGAVLDPVSVGVQLYRERLLVKALA